MCVTIKNGSEIKFEVNYRVTRNITLHEEGESKNSDNKSLFITKESTPLERNSSDITICVGSISDRKYSVVGSFAQVILNNIGDYSTIPFTKDQCDVAKDFKNLISFDAVGSTVLRGNVTRERYNFQELCRSTHVFLFFEVKAKFDEHYHLCQSLNGRLPYHDEVITFSSEMKSILIKKQNKNKTQNSDMWLVGGTEGAYNLTVNCPISNLVNMVYLSKPCISELDYAFCLVPKYSDFYYYGPLIKYDIFYTFQEKNGSLFLRGDEGTLLEKQNDYWIFHSELHEESAKLYNATVPVGRQTWKDSDGQFLLTFTHCEMNEFTCTNGDCFPIETRCNGTVECLDASDEKDCILINKKPGYSINRTPPHRINESLFILKYYVHIYNIADISTLDGIAVIDANISLTWYDPRVRFMNPVPDEEVDCQEIWKPIIAMADGAKSGFQINFKAYRSNCIVLSSQFGLIPHRFRDEKDSYNGQFIDGENLPISFLFAGLITVPCRFNLRKYPFGIQTCNITFWADNAFLTSRYKMESNFPSYDTNSSNELKYFGRKDLGEFFFISATHSVSRNDRMVVLTLKLKSLYGFHLLNSFTPSFLISLIAYSTLFFPISDFNERVMVSLTALVVMAVFFTQASNTSVRTPYFKLLDIWHVVLIIFCFFVVIANAMIRKIEGLENKKSKIHTLNSDEEICEKDSVSVGADTKPSKKLDKMNTFFELLFAGFLLVFVLLYSLGAAELM